ncbi:MORN repeat-containing protein [Portibacter marinus]|uniref:MORN repeat-containing protein n=1 Tax=Portibacter marinus TaxID=2898660 RepID=UPI001F289D23|nr:hypothetical protein [Portibacter marinus]
MSAYRSNLLLVMLTIAALGTALFFGLQTNKFKEELQALSITEPTDEDQILMKERLAVIDELLAKGEYQSALNMGAEIRSSVNRDQLSDLDLRMNIARRMADLDDEGEAEVVEKTTVDTVEKVVMKPVIPIDSKSDSLSFALEKAEMQLEILKEKVKQSSTGAYLTFKTSKGNALHYVGETENGKANGYGIAILDSGSRYEGEWKNNQRHGKGKFFWMDGERYEGEYKNDQRSGTGIYYWTNGEKYVGEWEEDMRNGKGKFYNAKGEVKASGIWKDDKLDEVEKNK